MNAIRFLRPKLATGLATLALAAAAGAQSFNIDVGCTPSTNPTGAYGAAAAQPGFWNWVNPGAPGAMQGLSSLAGVPTGAAVRITGGAGCYSFDNAGTAGDAEALMDDIEDVGGVGAVTTYEFFGLAPGGYWIYTYAWAPDDAAFRTKVIVPGAVDPDLEIGAAWPGGQRYLATFALHFVVYAGGPPLTLMAQTNVGAGSVNGFQIVTGGCDGEIALYCTAQVNSAGCTPAISTAGVPSVGAGAGFVISGNNVLCNVFGTLFYSRVGPAAMPFGGGTMCMLGPRRRTGIINSGCPLGGACGGRFDLDFNAWIPASGEAFAAGDSIWAQVWSRDAAAPSTTNLTDAVRFTVCF